MPNDARATRANREQNGSFRLLGTRVRLSGPPTFMELGRLVFSWFAAEGEAPADLDFEVRPEGPGFSVRVLRHGVEERLAFDSEENVFGHVYARVLDEVTRRNDDLLSVHAAALARDGRGVVLAAPSQHGKSTLALALSARGFTFLSDEVAPIRRSTRTLEPFPMAIGCRPGTYELLRDTLFEGHGFEPHRFTGKMLYDPTGDGSRTVEAVPLHAVFFLEPAGESARVRARYRLRVDPPAPAVAAEIVKLDGVRSATSESDGASLVLELEEGAWVAPGVERLLQEAGTLVTSVDDLDAPQPRFAEEPRLEKLPTTEGLMAIFRHLRGFGAVEELAAASPGGFRALLFDLAASLREVGFYRLTPGKLQPMVEAVESVLAAR